MSLTSAHLPPTGLISELNTEDRDALSSYGNFHIIEAGDTLISEGKLHGKLFFVINGLLHAHCNSHGRDVFLGSITPGEWVGEVDLFDPLSAICSVVAIQRTQYWVITRTDLEQFINTYPQAGIHILIGIAAMLSRRLREVTKKLTDQSEIFSIHKTWTKD